MKRMLFVLFALLLLVAPAPANGITFRSRAIFAAPFVPHVNVQASFGFGGYGHASALFAPSYGYGGYGANFAPAYVVPSFYATPIQTPCNQQVAPFQAPQQAPVQSLALAPCPTLAQGYRAPLSFASSYGQLGFNAARQFLGHGLGGYGSIGHNLAFAQRGLFLQRQIGSLRVTGINGTRRPVIIRSRTVIRR